MSFVRRTAAVACVATVLLGGLAGCSEDEPTPIMPDPSTPSPTTAPSEDPPLDYTPEAWEEKTDAGAIAFVEHWIDLLNQGRLTGETGPMTEASTRACKTCANFADIIATWYEPKATYESSPWKAIQIGQPQVSNARKTEVVVRIRRPKEIVDLGDSEPIRYAANDKTFVATLRWTEGQWLMESWRFSNETIDGPTPCLCALGAAQPRCHRGRQR